MTERSGWNALEVQYENTVDDLVSLNALVLRDLHRHRRVRSLVNLGIATLVVTLAITWMEVPFSDAWPLYAFVGLYALMGFVIAPALDRRRMRREIASDWAAPAPQRLAIGPDGFGHTVNEETRIVSWSEVPRLTHDGERLFVFVSADAAHVVPTRAFSTEEAFRRFVERAEDWWRAAG